MIDKFQLQTGIYSLLSAHGGFQRTCKCLYLMQLTQCAWVYERVAARRACLRKPDRLIEFVEGGCLAFIALEAQAADFIKTQQQYAFSSHGDDL